MLSAIMAKDEFLARLQTELVAASICKRWLDIALMAANLFNDRVDVVVRSREILYQM